MNLVQAITSKTLPPSTRTMEPLSEVALIAKKSSKVPESNRCKVLVPVLIHQMKIPLKVLVKDKLLVPAKEL